MPTIFKIQGNFKIQGGIYGLATFIWTGLGTDNNWSTNSNWNDPNFPTSNDFLIFAGSTRTAPFNDLTIDTPINNIEFASGAAAFQISGNRFVLNTGGITNNSSNLHQINNDIVLGSNAGSINCNTANILLRGNISGSGSLTKLGAQTLSLSGNNSYTGNTFISAGLISVLNDNALGTGSVFCSGGSGGFFISSNAAPTNTIINNRIFINGERPNFGSNIIANKSATFNGLITVGPNNRTNRLTVSNNATMTINGGISGLPTMASILTMNGVGTYILSSVPIIFNSTGATPIFSDSGTETVIIAVSGNRFQNISTGGTLRTDVPFAINNDNVILGFTGGNKPGRINLNGNDQIFRNIQNRSTTTFSDNSGNNIFNNSSTFANLTANNTSNTTYTGSISGNINLIKTGTSTLTLSGSTVLDVRPRYTGFTAISAGTLTVRTLSSDPSNKVNFASFTNTTLTVDFTTPPIAGDSFILLPARTINLYPAVTLQNASGRTGTYNSTNSTLTILPDLPITYLLVGGGGGAGVWGGIANGGGGAGGVLRGTIPAAFSSNITIGQGGAINQNGQNTIAFGLTAIGGGAGGAGGPSGFGIQPALSGGSGGGGWASIGASGTLNQGFSGGTGNGLGFHPSIGGGGGGGGAPGTLGFGGIGVINPIAGSTIGELSAGNYWVGGGGSGAGFSGFVGFETVYKGGLGGGGNGGYLFNSTTLATSGLPATGGGGGAIMGGGSGVVVLSYQSPTQRATGGTVTNFTSAGNVFWIHTFTSNGTFTI